MKLTLSEQSDAVKRRFISAIPLRAQISSASSSIGRDGSPPSELTKLVILDLLVALLVLRSSGALSEDREA